MKRRIRIENKIEKDLRLILKKGDLYDAIAKKRNAIPDTLLRKLIKCHTLIFSRILYLYLVYARRLKNSFTPVEKIKKAEDEIKNEIGLPVDIFVSKVDPFYNKPRKKKLGLVYCNYDYSGRDQYPCIEDLISTLRKLGSFCEEYKIEDIYIEKYFLNRYLSDEFLYTLETTNHARMLIHEEMGVPYYTLVKTNPKEINTIISKLENSKYDNTFIYSLRSKIKNKQIKNAIDKYQRTNNGENLLNIVKNELFKLINEDAAVKDRIYGKIYQSYEIGDKFLRRTELDREGNIIGRNIITLYNYLEVTNYSHLEDIAFNESEDKELKLESLLYLHLLGEKLKEQRKDIEFTTLYEYIYDKYKTTKRHKKIPWIKTLIEKRKAEGKQYAMSLFSIILTWIMIMLGIYIPNNWLSLNNKTLDEYNDFINKIKHAYEESYDFEHNIRKSIQQYIEKLLPKRTEKEMQKEYQKPANSSNKDNESGKIAEIEWFSKEKMPLYFVDQYASSGKIYDGEFKFWLSNQSVNLWNLVDVRPLFQIKYSISKTNLEKAIDGTYFHIPLEACPAGDNYALTQIYIKDENDPTKYMKIDSEWFETHHSQLIEEEKELLRSMENPMIYYIYGLSTRSNIQIPVNGNYTDNPKDVKEAILEGLELDKTSTEEEIREKIAEKEYTKYPFYNPKKDIDELEYYETLASLDAIDIDIASILTTMSNENSMYVSGFKNLNGDNEITLDEAYLWVIDENGEIIDFLADLKGEGGLTINTEENNWLDYEEEKENNFINEEENKSEEKKYEFTDDNKEQEENITYEETEEDRNEDKESKTKTVLSKITTWAKEHHIPYYIAIAIALLIVYKIFGKKIKHRIKLVKANNIISAEDIGETYAILKSFIYGGTTSPRHRNKSQMLERIVKDFQSFSEDDINSLLELLKETNNDQEKTKEIEELLKTIPFIIDYRYELENYKPKRLVLGGKHEK